MRHDAGRSDRTKTTTDSTTNSCLLDLPISTFPASGSRVLLSVNPLFPPSKGASEALGAMISWSLSLWEKEAKVSCVGCQIMSLSSFLSAETVKRKSGSEQPLVDVWSQSSLKKERESACRRCYDVSVSRLDISSIFIVHFMVILSSSLPSLWETGWSLGAHPFSHADVAIDVGVCWRTLPATTTNFNARRRQELASDPYVTALRLPAKMGSSRHAAEFILPRHRDLISQRTMDVF